MSRHVGPPVIPEQADDGWAPLTPMILACLFAHPECVRHLLRHNCPTGATIQRGPDTVHGDSALHMALKRHVGLLSLIVTDERRPEEIRAAAKECAELILAKHRADEPLSFSAKHLSDLFTSTSPIGANDQKCAAMVQLLLDAKVDPNLLTALSPEVVRILVCWFRLGLARGLREFNSF